VLVYNALYYLLPAYLAEDCQLVSVTGGQRLHFSDINTKHVPSAVNQHTSWRLLIRCCWTLRMKQSANPAVRVVITLRQFQQAVKTHLFGH